MAPTQNHKSSKPSSAETGVHTGRVAKQQPRPRAQHHAVPKGERTVQFDSLAEWQHRDEVLGKQTKSIAFMVDYEYSREMTLKDEYLDALINRDDDLCSRLTKFKSNDAASVTSAALIRFSEACPNLTHLELQGLGSAAADEALVAIFTNCPHIQVVDFSLPSDGNSSHGLGGGKKSALNILKDNPDLAPDLKKLRVMHHGGMGNSGLMTAVRALTKERRELVVECGDMADGRRVYKDGKGKKMRWTPKSREQTEKRQTEDYYTGKLLGALAGMRRQRGFGGRGRW